ncbi:hypothetical protein [Paenibacillus lutrae]|uniref:Uncharacterized protein n=1 Tax=Paenibacillus lutrae TaxID=2078573 RepID=A0A7X3K1M4_9BACL|nr:hypothetical protein [Paenibacillus lutrae]MVP02151.1 hypothetical protein [Paenibacillus lutrae]
MKFTYQDFIAFARAFEEQNCFDFCENEVRQADREEWLFFYDATFRDESNYKTNVCIQFNELSGEIGWDIGGGWDDAIREIEILYQQLFGKRLGYQLVERGEDADRVYSVLKTIMEGIHKAENGLIPFAAVFNGLRIRDCLPEHTVLGSTWHISEIRDKFPTGTTDKELFSELRNINGRLTDAAISSGREVIEKAL